jgi:hypothetical protein
MKRCDFAPLREMYLRYFETFPWIAFRNVLKKIIAQTLYSSIQLNPPEVSVKALPVFSLVTLWVPLKKI